MLGALLIVLVILWFFGYVRVGNIATPDIPLLAINNHVITLWDLLILVVVSWVISILPGPLRLVAGVLFILWILSTLGILSFIAIPGLSSILIIAIIIGIVLSLF